MNNPFGDFMGKSTEITDLVMHPNQYVENILEQNLNTINNNLINNGTHDVDENFIANENTQNFQPQQEINPFTLNDDNNNSNNNFNNSDMGPETNVDPDDEFSQNEEVGEAAGGEKEKIQTEPKETDDLNEIVPDNCSGFDEFTGGCDDDPVDGEPANNEEKQEESSFDNKQSDTIDFGGETLITGFMNQLDQIGERMDNENTSCEVDEDPYEQSTEQKIQDAFDPFSNNYQDDIGEEQFEQQQVQFMHSPLENINENVHLESAEADHDEMMDSDIQEESICANEVTEEIQLQEPSLMTGKPEFLIPFFRCI
jgi:hypothetical protein